VHPKFKAVISLTFSIITYLSGVMPKVNMAIINTTKDVFWGTVFLAADMPITFPVFLGTINATI
jgi:hypothetical protein